MNAVLRYTEYYGYVSKKSLTQLREFKEVYMIEVVQEFFYWIRIFYLSTLTEY